MHHGGGDVSSKPTTSSHASAVVSSNPATEWLYRGEGNCSLVISNGKKNIVYRLMKKYEKEKKEKCHKKAKLDYDVTKAKFLGTISYVREVMEDLLGPDLVFPGVLVNLPEDFSSYDLEAIVSKARPAHRQHKTIDTNCPFAVSLPDFCFLPSAKNQSSPYKTLRDTHPTYSIEIKPKCGYLPNKSVLKKHSDIKSTVCRFCMHQQLKFSSGQWNQLSRYCPIDLFSGNPDRMMHALFMLLETPQNNLRIFKNGKLVWGDGQRGCRETLDDLNYVFPACKQHEATKDSTTVENPLSKHVNIENLKNLQPDDCDLSKAQGFLEVVQQCLVYNLSSHANSTTDHATNFSSQSCLAHKSTVSHTTDCSGVAGNSVLGRILAAQKLDDLDIEGIMPLYHQVQQYMEQHQHKRNLLNCTRLGKSPHIRDQKSIDYAKYKIQNYLISRSVKDCSIMIAIQPNTSHSRSLSEVCHSIHHSSEGRRYNFRVAVIDLDPKAWQKIPTYMEQDDEIVTNYVNNHLQH